MSKLKLARITLKAKTGKKMEFSAKEAKELYGQLHKLFGRPGHYKTTV